MFQALRSHMRPGATILPAEVPENREVMPLLVPVGIGSGEDRSLRPTLVGISLTNTLDGYRL